MGARNRVGIGFSYWPAGGIDSLEWIPGLLKSLKILAQENYNLLGSRRYSAAENHITDIYEI